MSKRNGRGGEKKARFVSLPHYIMDTMAWSRLSVAARAAWLEFDRLYNGRNNGRLIMSSRMLKGKLGTKSMDTAQRAIKELVTFGFLVRTRASEFSSKRIAAEYLMTHLPDNRTDPPDLALRTFQNIGKTACLKIVRSDSDD